MGYSLSQFHFDISENFLLQKKKDEGITIDFFDRVSIFLFERCETISKFYFFIKLSFLLLDFCYYVLFDAETRQACHEVEKITMLDPFIWLPSFARGRIWTIHVQAAWPFNFIQSSVQFRQFLHSHFTAIQPIIFLVNSNRFYEEVSTDCRQNFYCEQLRGFLYELVCSR